MGTQQLLLIIVGIIITAVAIAVGIQLFGSSSTTSNRDAIINDINNIAANAKQYRSKIRQMGGGGGSYVGYTIPPLLDSNDDAAYGISVQPASVVITGTSALGYGTVQATIDSNGAAGGWVYTGQMQ